MNTTFDFSTGVLTGIIIKQNYKNNKTEKNIKNQQLILPPKMSYISPYNADEDEGNDNDSKKTSSVC